MKHYFSLIFALFIALSALGQGRQKPWSLTGKAIETGSREPMPYVTVAVKDSLRSRPFALFASNESGKFSGSLTKRGEMIVVVSAMGKDDFIKPLSVDSLTERLDLGEIAMEEMSKELSGVEIVAKKPLVVADVDKIGYDIEADPESRTSTITQMLRKVPMVTVDGEDNIKINGSESYKVFVNGKPNNMMTRNAKDVLRGMPASSIKKIEVITNPGAKYDAEGITAILNIVTQGVRLDGYNVSLSATQTVKDSRVGAYGAVQVGKFMLSANTSFSNRLPEKLNVWQDMLSRGALTELSSDLDAQYKQKERAKQAYANIESSFEIDTLRLVTLSLGYWGNFARTDQDLSARSLSSLTQSFQNSYHMLNPQRKTTNSLDLALDYQRLFKRKGQVLTLSYKLTTSPVKMRDQNRYIEFNAAPAWETMRQTMRDRNTRTRENTSENTFQADFALPLDSMQLLEVGGKYIFRANRSNNDDYYAPMGTEDYSFSEDKSLHYRHENDILSAYLSYRLSVRKFTLKAGLRYEHTSEKVTYRMGQGEDFRAGYANFVPSASVGWKINDRQNFSFGYKMGISRPGIWSLNPYISDSGLYAIQQGNTNLKSEKTHNLNMQYGSYGMKWQANVYLSQSFTSSSIESTMTKVMDTSIEGYKDARGREVYYSTWANVGKVRRSTMGLYLKWNISPSTGIWTSDNVYYTYLNDNQGLKNHGWAAFGMIGLDQSFKHDWRISAHILDITPSIGLQQRSNSYRQYQVSASKQLLRKRLTVSVSATNFLNHWEHLSNSTFSNDYHMRQMIDMTMQNFSIGVAYRLGNLSSQVRKARRTIENDDIKKQSEK